MPSEIRTQWGFVRKEPSFPQNVVTILLNWNSLLSGQRLGDKRQLPVTLVFGVTFSNLEDLSRSVCSMRL
jgi:hypothetical protein